MAGSRPSMASRSSCRGSRVISARSFCASFARILGSGGDGVRHGQDPRAPALGPGLHYSLTLSSRSWDTPFRALEEVLAGDGASETAGSPAPAAAVPKARLARAFSICSCGRGRRSWVTLGAARAGGRQSFPSLQPSAAEPSLPARRTPRGASPPLGVLHLPSRPRSQR